MSHKKPSADLYHPIGYESNQQHLNQHRNPKDRNHTGPQAGLDGEESSRICGQIGPELLGGSASTRILGQSVSEQLNTSLPSSNRQ